jgi:hypothetical protein
VERGREFAREHKKFTKNFRGGGVEGEGKDLGKDFLLKKLKQRQQMLDERHEAKQHKNRISQRQKQPKAETAKSRIS